MSVKTLLENAVLDSEGAAVPIVSSQCEISVIGVWGGATVYFQDNKQGMGWADVLDVNTGERLDITEDTNEIELLAATNCGRQLKAFVSGGDETTLLNAKVFEGVL